MPTQRPKNAANLHRRRARSVVNDRVGRDVFLAAQGFKCPYCRQPLSIDETTIDHVHPISRKWRNAGNILLMHAECNQTKGDRVPATHLKKALATVNACLQFDDETQRYGGSYHPVFKHWNRVFEDSIDIDLIATVDPGKFMFDMFKLFIFKVLA
jgi:hypothetical protein